MKICAFTLRPPLITLANPRFPVSSPSHRLAHHYPFKLFGPSLSFTELRSNSTFKKSCIARPQELDISPNEITHLRNQSSNNDNEGDSRFGTLRFEMSKGNRITSKPLGRVSLDGIGSFFFSLSIFLFGHHDSDHCRASTVLPRAQGPSSHNRSCCQRRANRTRPISGHCSPNRLGSWL